MKKIEIKQNCAIIRLTQIELNRFSIQVKKLNQLDKNDLRILTLKFNKVVIKKKIEIMSFNIPSYSERNFFLNKTTYKSVTTKILYWKELTNKIKLDLEKYNFMSCGHLTITELYSYFKAVSIADEEVERNHKAYLNEMIQMAGPSFDISNWKIVYYLNHKIGLICPQMYPDESGEGSLFYIGLLPAFRRQKHGLIMHAHGLNLLIEQGVNKYIGSTNEKNIAMIKIFNSNKCIMKYSQIYYNYEN